MQWLLTADSASAPFQAVFVLETRAQAEDALAVRPHLAGPVGYFAFSSSAADALANWDEMPAGDQVWVTPWQKTWTPRIAKLVAILRGRALLRRLARTKPRPVFVFGNDMNSVDRALIEFATGLGVWTLLVQDGVLNEYNFADAFDWPVSPASRFALMLARTAGLVPPFAPYGTGGCSRIAAFGQRSREMFIAWGVPESKIVVTGSPRLGPPVLKGRAGQPSPGIRRVLYVSVVLAAAGIAPDAADDIWTAALGSLVRERPSWEVLLRPHPQEPVNLYSRLRTGYPTLRIDAVSTFHDLLWSADVVVVHFPSTGVLEALALGRPVVFLDLGYHYSTNLYTSDVGLVTVARPDNLVATLERVAREQTIPAVAAARDAALCRHLGPLDGRSGERVAAIIESLRECGPGQEAPRPRVRTES